MSNYRVVGTLDLDNNYKLESLEGSPESCAELMMDESSIRNFHGSPIIKTNRSNTRVTCTGCEQLETLDGLRIAQEGSERLRIILDHCTELRSIKALGQIKRCELVSISYCDVLRSLEGLPSDYVGHLYMEQYVLTKDNLKYLPKEFGEFYYNERTFSNGVSLEDVKALVDINKTTYRN